MRVALYINHESGKFDHRNFVARFTIPPFAPPPDVLTWGIRTFIRHDGKTDGTGRTIYVEAFAVAIVSDPE